MEKNDFIRLKHMLEAAHTCMHFSTGKVRMDFEKDQMLSFAIIRALEIFGEAASRMSNEFQQANPHIPESAGRSEFKGPKGHKGLKDLKDDQKDKFFVV